MTPNSTLQAFFQSHEMSEKEAVERHDDETVTTQKSFWNRIHPRMNPLTRPSKYSKKDDETVTTASEDSRLLGVSFASQDEIIQIISIEDYTEEEIYSTWYSVEDYVDINDNIDKTLLLMQAGAKMKKRKYCPRGLEYMTEDGYVERIVRRRRSQQAVFDEQAAQLEASEDYPDVVANLYSKLAKESRSTARLDAQNDAWDIMEYMSPNHDIVMAQTHHLMSFQKRMKSLIEEEPVFQHSLDIVPEEDDDEDDVRPAVKTQVDSITAAKNVPQRGLLRSDASFKRVLKADKSLWRRIKLESLRQDSLRKLSSMRASLEGKIIPNVIPKKVKPSTPRAA